jgi:hypothetical protein
MEDAGLRIAFAMDEDFGARGHWDRLIVIKRPKLTVPI